MVIKFKQVQLRNFCSYKNATVNLLERGFCLVSGINNCIKDNAISNGAGKSTIWSAICFAITGETISGVKTNVKNINNEDSNEEGYVRIEMSIDRDSYELTRIFSPKSDLKIVKNGIDISGKGIKSSEKILTDHLPDLTKNLISSTIILGQHMPNRFSSFSPSGRKDLLETLTKSDFMIEDIKTRIAERQAKLALDLRSFEDSLLLLRAQLSNVTISLHQLEAEKASQQETVNDSKIESLEETLVTKIAYKTKLETRISELESVVENLTMQTMSLADKKANLANSEFSSYTAAYNEIMSEKNMLEAEARALELEIYKINSITDVCPTCRQKIPGVLKPSAHEYECKLHEIKDKILPIDKKLQEISNKHTMYVKDIDNQYSQIESFQQQVKDSKTELSNARTQLEMTNKQIVSETSQLDRLKNDRLSFQKNMRELNRKISMCNAEIGTLNNNISLSEAGKTTVESHISTVKKIESLVKRDFRGYLLYNIIDYLNTKVKEYSNIVFGNDALNVCISGNAIDISYCGKLYEVLSGGEKQRVDVIIQFAIRDLLQEYFSYSSNILVLDEITDSLDKIATAKIFDLILSQLKDVESTFIISHHDTELAIPVDSELQVIKDKNGISTIKET